MRLEKKWLSDLSLIDEFVFVFRGDLFEIEAEKLLCLVEQRRLEGGVDFVQHSPLLCALACEDE